MPPGGDHPILGTDSAQTHKGSANTLPLPPTPPCYDLDYQLRNIKAQNSYFFLTS